MMLGNDLAIEVTVGPDLSLRKRQTSGKAPLRARSGGRGTLRLTNQPIAWFALLSSSPSNDGEMLLIGEDMLVQLKLLALGLEEHTTDRDFVRYPSHCC